MNLVALEPRAAKLVVMITVRPAKFDDFPIIAEFDEFLGDRRLDMQSGLKIVADLGEQTTVGYIRIGPSELLGWPCLTALCVRSDCRRRGVGHELLVNAQAEERFTKLFTTTEQSNAPMHSLLSRVGARKVGEIDALNLNDETEMIYLLNP